MSATLLPGQTRTSSLYYCPECGVTAKAIMDSDLGEPFCGGSPFCGVPLYDEDRVAPGRIVYLHHAKSAERKFGYVLKTGRSRMTLWVESADGETGFTTTRNVNDPDLRWEARFVNVDPRFVHITL